MFGGKLVAAFAPRRLCEFVLVDLESTDEPNASRRERMGHLHKSLSANSTGSQSALADLGLRLSALVVCVDIPRRIVPQRGGNEEENR